MHTKSRPQTLRPAGMQAMSPSLYQKIRRVVRKLSGRSVRR